MFRTDSSSPTPASAAVDGGDAKKKLEPAGYYSEQNCCVYCLNNLEFNEQEINVEITMIQSSRVHSKNR